MSDEINVTDQENNSQPSEAFSYFIPLMKVDEEKQEVYGWATIEEPDHANEIMDYASSKENFLKWSQAAKDRSGGKSLGNIRAMHNNIAAGKAVQLIADDAKKSIWVGAKITNPAEWDQVREGVYTGFSIGGKYVKRWFDNGYMRYTADPHEISIVDAPAVPHATFQMIKADGSVQNQPFRKADLPPTPEPGKLPVEEVTAQKDPATFNTLTLNINLIPGAPAFQAAGNPNQQIVDMPVNPSPATDNSPAFQPAGRNEAAYKADPPIPTKGEPPMKKGTFSSSTAMDLLTTAKSNMSSNPDLAASALDQLSSMFDVSVDHADLDQDSSSDATTAASVLGVTTQSTGPTTQAFKTTDPSVPAVGGTTTTGGVSSTPGKSTPTQMESDTFHNASTGGTTVGGTPTTTPSTAPSTVKKDAAESTDSVTTPDQIFSKGDSAMTDTPSQPLSTNPPMVNTFVSGQSVTDNHLPAFIAALEGGSLRKAQAIVKELNGGYMDQSIFDEMVLKSQKRLMDEGGWNYTNLQKGMLSRGMGFMPSDDQALKKAISIGDIPNIYLIRLVKLMLPLYAGLRRRLPANPPAVGSNQAQWRTELGTSNFNFATAMAVAEAATGQTVNETFLSFAAPFKRIALNDAVTLEAVYGARGFDDPLQVAVIRALTLLLGTEERKLLGDNAGSIAAPTNVAMVNSATGGTLAAGSYIPYVTALTYRGWLNATPASGVGESTTGSAAQVVTTGATSSLPLTWSAVKGASAYNVYVSQNGTNRFVATVTTDTYTITAFPGAGASYPATDSTANTNGFEGLMSWCDLSTIYGNAIPNKTFIDQAGSGLTTYAGGISEFDTVLSALWTNWQIAPSLIVTSPNGAKHLTKQILSSSNVSGYRIEIGQERGTISGGAFVTGYTNKFAPFADGTPRVIDIMAHPYMPDGTFKFVSESVPYPMAREARGFAIETLIPYTYFPLAQSTIQYPFSMLCSEVLECFHPGAQASISSVDVSK